MTESDSQPFQEEIAGLRARLDALSATFTDAAPENRQAILQSMWELIGHIAQVNERTRRYEDEKAGEDAGVRVGAR